MSHLAHWWSAVPGERRPVAAAAVVVVIGAAVTTGATVAAWGAQESDALLALVVAIAGLAAGCGALAAYVLWLRRAVCRRMAGMSRLVLGAPAPAEQARPAVRAVERPDGPEPSLALADWSVSEWHSVVVPR